MRTLILCTHTHKYTHINYTVSPSLHKEYCSYWPSCSHNVHRGPYYMIPIAAVQRYINLSLVTRLCPTPEQSLCSPSLQVLVPLITLQVYRPPFITSKYHFAGHLTPQKHHRVAENQPKQFVCKFFTKLYSNSRVSAHILKSSSMLLKPLQRKFYVLSTTDHTLRLYNKILIYHNINIVFFMFTAYLCNKC